MGRRGGEVFCRIIIRVEIEASTGPRPLSASDDRGGKARGLEAGAGSLTCCCSYRMMAESSKEVSLRPLHCHRWQAIDGSEPVIRAAIAAGGRQLERTKGAFSSVG